MKIEGQISIFINREYTSIEVTDKHSNTRFLDIKLTPQQLNDALSRIGNTECELDVIGLEKIGKKHECKTFEFEIEERLASSTHSDKLYKITEELLTDGWVADSYFGSQNSFFNKDGKQMARCTIRRWI